MLNLQTRIKALTRRANLELGDITEARTHVPPSSWRAQEGKQAQAFDLVVNSAQEVIFYGGGKGGGKTELALGACDTLCRKYAGFKVLVVRKAFNELNKYFKRAVMMGEGALSGFSFNSVSPRLEYKNKSLIELSHLGNGITHLQGAEYDLIIVEEAGHIKGMGELIPDLQSLQRGGVAGFNKKMLLTGNPGGVATFWIRDVFFMGQAPTGWEFVFAVVHDNKLLLERDPKYLDRLKAGPMAMQKAYLEGDFTYVQGLAFDVILNDALVDTPSEFDYYVVGMDWGFSERSKAVGVLVGVREDVEYFEVIDQVIGIKLQPHEFVEELVGMVERNGLNSSDISVFYDPAMANESQTGIKIYDVITAPLRNKFAYWHPGRNSRQDGYMIMATLVESHKIKFVREKTKVIYDTILALPLDPHKGDMDVDTKADDHAYDALRYAVYTLYKSKNNAIKVLKKVR